MDDKTWNRGKGRDSTVNDPTDVTQKPLNLGGNNVAARLHWQRRLRRWHRAIAMVTALQLLAWTVSGIYFAFVDIEEVRGKAHRLSQNTREFDLNTLTWITHTSGDIAIRERLPGEWIVGTQSDSGRAWHTVTGTPVNPLSATQAISLTAALTDLSGDRAELITEQLLGAEYRGKSLPLWRVTSDSHNVVIYIDALSGEVAAIRNDAWRWWDLLWSLHIMDYDDRDTIGTLLLKIFSVLALVTALAGIMLYLLIPKRQP